MCFMWDILVIIPLSLTEGTAAASKCSPHDVNPQCQYTVNNRGGIHARPLGFTCLNWH